MISIIIKKSVLYSYIILSYNFIILFLIYLIYLNLFLIYLIYLNICNISMNYIYDILFYHVKGFEIEWQSFYTNF